MSGSVDPWNYITNARDSFPNATVTAFYDNFLRTLGPAVRDCGEDVIAGLEFDYEGKNKLTIFGPGYFPEWESHGLSMLMDKMQKAVGGNFTVSCDVGVPDIDVSPFGGSYLVTKPWVDAAIFKANPHL